MAVLVKTIRQFIGSSRDVKPFIGDSSSTTSADLPYGSTFLESDTGAMWTWDGGSWHKAPVLDISNALVAAIDLLRLEVVQLRYGMIDAGTCEETKLKDYQEAFSDYYREPV